MDQVQPFSKAIAAARGAAMGDGKPKWRSYVSCAKCKKGWIWKDRIKQGSTCKHCWTPWPEAPMAKPADKPSTPQLKDFLTAEQLAKVHVVCPELVPAPAPKPVLGSPMDRYTKLGGRIKALEAANHQGCRSHIGVGKKGG